MKNRGQVSIFIIVALVIVVLGVLVYLFYPSISSRLGGDAEPSSFLKNCIEPDLKEGIELLSRQGGYVNPEGSIMYQGNDIKYLCYTSNYYVPCYVQVPLLRQTFEQELEGLIERKADECVADLKDYYEKRGFDVSGIASSNAEINIVANNIDVVVNAPMTITRDETQSFEEFNFEVSSKMYSLLMVSLSIVDFESTYGDSETTLYMRYYPNLKIQKTKLGDGSTIYTVSDVTTEESFTFASRSLAWPAGWGL